MTTHSHVQAALDSLNQIVAHKNALLSAWQARVDSLAAATPDTVIRVAMPADMPPTPWYESNLVAATLGGLIATVASFGTLWVTRLLDNRRIRKRLRKRIEICLGTAVRVAQAVGKKDETHPIEPRPLRNLVVEWSRYDRMSDDLGLLNLPQLEDRIDATLGAIRMIAEKVMADEEGYSRTIREVGNVGPTGFTVDPDVENKIRAHRKHLLAMVARMGNEASELLAECNKVWRPGRGYEDVSVPIGRAALPKPPARP